jgi:hypothetical protein
MSTMKIRTLLSGFLCTVLLTSCSTLGSAEQTFHETPTTFVRIATESTCDNLTFISDSSIPDGTVMTAGQEFIKTWKVKNIGSCTWTTGYNIAFAYGEKLGGQDTALTAEVLPNTEAEISLTLKAPPTVGTYKSFWHLANNNGSAFGPFLSVVILVQ